MSMLPPPLLPLPSQPSPLCILPPQVMQALVEHYVAAGQPELVEQCVLKMDIMSLDLNQVGPLHCTALHCTALHCSLSVLSSMLGYRNGHQAANPEAAAAVLRTCHLPLPTAVTYYKLSATSCHQPPVNLASPYCPALQLIPLCIQHRLFAALLHIFPAALLDYQTPAALLLVASAAAGEAEAAEAPAAAAGEAVVGLEAEPAPGLQAAAVHPLPPAWRQVPPG